MKKVLKNFNRETHTHYFCIKNTNVYYQVDQETDKPIQFIWKKYIRLLVHVQL